KKVYNEKERQWIVSKYRFSTRRYLMDLELLKDWFTLENIMDLIKEYRSLGPLPGLLLTMLEAFLPFLPLFLFVMANASAFGLWLGFLFSWLGATAGALIVF